MFVGEKGVQECAASGVARPDQLAQEISSPPIRYGEALPSSLETLGVTYDEERGGSHVNLEAPNGREAYLCETDPGNRKITLAEHRLIQVADGRFGGFIPGLKPGAHYGFRLDPHEHAPGHRGMLLMDTRAREIVWDFKSALPNGERNPAVYPYKIYPDGSHNLFERGEGDSAPFVPRCVVVPNDTYDWEGIGRPEKNPGGEVIYEASVEALTKLHPDIPEELRGTYAGLAHPKMIEYFQQLGITALELMPCMKFVTEPHLQAAGLENAWGYNTLGFFAPHDEYSSSKEPGGQIREFRDMVKALHKAGIKVIMDVVYNHTPEQGWDGPMLGFRGLDSEYYRYTPTGDCDGASGCGNTFSGHDLMIDSLKYWAKEMGVDGFRFDLASVLTEGEESVQRSRFMETLKTDPDFADLYISMEPWGAFRYDRGAFAPFKEWDDTFWENVRPFFRGAGIQLPARAMAAALGGVLDPHAKSYGNPYVAPLVPWKQLEDTAPRRVSFIAAHDGFTPYDAVANDRKNNWKNGEHNRDGNNSPKQAGRVGGEVDGYSGDPVIEAKRHAVLRAMITFQAASRGDMMMVYGSENARSQDGNNNAYCQKGLNRMPWKKLREDQRALLAYTQQVIAFRHQHPGLTRPHTFLGKERGLFTGAQPELDHEVFTAAGNRMSDEPGAPYWQRVMQMYISGVSQTPEKPQTPDDYDVSVVINGTDTPQIVNIPKQWPYAGTWEIAIDSGEGVVYQEGEGPVIDDEGAFVIWPLATMVLIRRAQRLSPEQLAVLARSRTGEQESTALRVAA